MSPWSVTLIRWPQKDGLSPWSRPQWKQTTPRRNVNPVWPFLALSSRNLSKSVTCSPLMMTALRVNYSYRSLTTLLRTLKPLVLTSWTFSNVVLVKNLTLLRSSTTLRIKSNLDWPELAFQLLYMMMKLNYL